MRRRRARARRGIVLVAAIALLALAAALLAGSAIASDGLRRATRGLVAAARVESEGRRALGDVLVRWDGAADSLPLGGSLERPLPASVAAGPMVVARARVTRLTPSVFAASVTVQVSSGTSLLAYRRVRLLLERSSRSDSASAAGPPTPIARWSVIELH